jgi:DNA-binding NarL/FixJ family response regulator
MPSLIRVGIVDPNEIVRDALRVFFETTTDMRLIGDCDSGEEALNLCSRAKPDVVLMEFLNDFDNLHLIAEFHRRNPGMKVLILTTNLTPQRVVETLEQGVQGYLFKQTDVDELSAAIRTVYGGGHVYDQQVRDMIASNR